MFKSIDRVEFTAANGNTVRFDLSPEGGLKVAAIRNGHFQSTSVLSDDDRAALLAWLVGSRNTEQGTRVVVLNDGETFTSIDGCVVLDVPANVCDDHLDGFVADNFHTGTPVIG